jgi:hypothetical protein
MPARSYISIVKILINIKTESTTKEKACQELLGNVRVRIFLPDTHAWLPNMAVFVCFIQKENDSRRRLWYLTGYSASPGSAMKPPAPEASLYQEHP